MLGLRWSLVVVSCTAAHDLLGCLLLDKWLLELLLPGRRVTASMMIFFGRRTLLNRLGRLHLVGKGGRWTVLGVSFAIVLSTTIIVKVVVVVRMLVAPAVPA